MCNHRGSGRLSQAIDWIWEEGNDTKLGPCALGLPWSPRMSELETVSITIGRKLWGLWFQKSPSLLCCKLRIRTKRWQEEDVLSIPCHPLDLEVPNIFAFLILFFFLSSFIPICLCILDVTKYIVGIIISQTEDRDRWHPWSSTGQWSWGWPWQASPSQDYLPGGLQVAKSSSLVDYTGSGAWCQSWSPPLYGGWPAEVTCLLPPFLRGYLVGGSWVNSGCSTHWASVLACCSPHGGRQG